MTNCIFFYFIPSTDIIRDIFEWLQVHFMSPKFMLIDDMYAFVQKCHSTTPWACPIYARPLINVKPYVLLHKMLWINSLDDVGGNVVEHSCTRMSFETHNICHNNKRTQCDIDKNMCYELCLFKHTMVCISRRIFGPS